MISGNNGNRVREAPISRGRIYAYVMPTELSDVAGNALAVPPLVERVGGARCAYSSAGCSTAIASPTPMVPPAITSA